MNSLKNDNKYSVKCCNAANSQFFIQTSDFEAINIFCANSLILRRRESIHIIQNLTVR
jgi:hypothetical protein